MRSAATSQLGLGCHVRSMNATDIFILLDHDGYDLRASSEPSG